MATTLPLIVMFFLIFNMATQILKHQYLWMEMLDWHETCIFELDKARSLDRTKVILGVELPFETTESFLTVL